MNTIIYFRNGNPSLCLKTFLTPLIYFSVTVHHRDHPSTIFRTYGAGRKHRAKYYVLIIDQQADTVFKNSGTGNLFL